eukprot:UN11683
MYLHAEHQPGCHRNRFRLMNQSAKLGCRVDLSKLFSLLLYHFHPF